MNYMKKVLSNEFIEKMTISSRLGSIDKWFHILSKDRSSSSGQIHLILSYQRLNV